MEYPKLEGTHQGYCVWFWSSDKHGNFLAGAGNINLCKEIMGLIIYIVQNKIREGSLVRGGMSLCEKQHIL